MQLPPEARGVIEEFASRVPPAVLKRAVGAMTEHYRGRLGSASLVLSAEEKIAAYLVTRLPATYAAAHAVLSEVGRRLGELRLVSALDLGAGAGAATLALRAVFSALEHCTLIEADRAFAGIAAKLIPNAELRVEDLRRLDPLPAHDLLVASYSLGELRAEDRRAVLERAWQAAGAVLVVVEPGSPAGFAVIRDARDCLIRRGAHIIAPCPGEGPCPMTAPDWCHFGQRVERTSLHRRMKGGALGYEDEKFSYVALAKEAVHRAQQRIIRRPEHHPGLIQLVLCRGDDVRTERVTRRHPDEFRDARRAEWGGEWHST